LQKNSEKKAVSAREDQKTLVLQYLFVYTLR